MAAADVICVHGCDLRVIVEQHIGKQRQEHQDRNKGHTHQGTFIFDESAGNVIGLSVFFLSSDLFGGNSLRLFCYLSHVSFCLLARNGI